MCSALYFLVSLNKPLDPYHKKGPRSPECIPMMIVDNTPLTRFRLLAPLEPNREPFETPIRLQGTFPRYTNEADRVHSSGQDSIAWIIRCPDAFFTLRIACNADLLSHRIVAVVGLLSMRRPRRESRFSRFDSTRNRQECKEQPRGSTKY
ncbi:hypothetical protein BDW69DRAFT_143376 [Aspergillus filifer]